jgi:putative nucleotidyltransferase with HDIG domain
MFNDLMQWIGRVFGFGKDALPKKSRWEGIPTTRSKARSTSAADPALPLGSRLRPQSGGYSLSVAQMEEVSRGLKDIPPLPQGVLQVMRELDSKEASAASVADAIGREPVMAASILRVANSEATGLRREITSVAEAVAYLGFSTTKTLFLRFKMSALFSSPGNKSGYDSERVWIHSIAVSQASEELARRAGGADSNLALTAGLLHDIGRFAINRQHPHGCAELWALEAQGEGLLERERRLFGADHAFIGSALAAEWKLPQDLVQMIRLHHVPPELLPTFETTVRRALLCVQIANQLVKFRHVYCSGMEIDQIPQTVAQELRLPEWPQLVADERLTRTIDRAILLNGGQSQPTAIAA